MRKWGRSAVVTAAMVSALLALLVAGCGESSSDSDSSASATETATQEPQGPFIVNSLAAPLTLDPQKVADTASIGVVRALYSTLLQYEQKPVEDVPDGVEVVREDQTKVIPYLAESYEVSEDGTTITFKLRADAKFSTGRPITSEAVKASFERGIKLGAGAAYYARIGQNDLDVQYETPDDLTFIAKAKRAEALFPYAFAQPQSAIVDVEEVEAQGGDTEKESNTWIATNSAGAGPYIVKEYTAGSKLTLEANPTYFDEAPREKEVIINWVRDNQTLLLQARNGAAHVTLGLNQQSVKSLEGQDCCSVVAIPTHGALYLAMPMKAAPFDNVKFREALTYAVPYEDILAKVGQGYGELFYGPWAPQMPGYNAQLEQPRTYDLDKAKALIEESGVKTPLDVKLLTLADVPDMEEVATIVQDIWRGLGINLKIQQLPAAEYSSEDGIFYENKDPLLRRDAPQVVNPLFQGDYDLRCETWDGNTNWTNVSDNCNRTVEDLLNEAHRAPGGEGNQERFDKITEEWTASAPRIPFYAQQQTFVLSKDVKFFSHATAGSPTSIDVRRWGR